MTTSLAPLRIRQHLGRKDWSTPAPFGPDGWVLQRFDGMQSVIVSCAEQDDGAEWVHASIAGLIEMPTYDDLAVLHRAVFEGGYAYQCFVPSVHHVNIHERALHLWGRLDGQPALPEFGMAGSI